MIVCKPCKAFLIPTCQRSHIDPNLNQRFVLVHLGEASASATCKC